MKNNNNKKNTKTFFPLYLEFVFCFITSCKRLQLMRIFFY